MSILGEQFPKSLVYEFSTSLYGWRTEYAPFKRSKDASFTSD